MIKINQISKSYGEKKIFEQFSLEIPSNQITCILGDSGIGKTTLLNMIAGITPYQGEILAEKKIAYIFQEPRLIPTMKVIDNLRFISPEVKEEDIDSLLSKLEILDKKNMYPNELSGGEQQRVSIARAFLYDAPIILMDEPFSSLDISLKYRLICYFAELWNANKKTVVFVTHNIDEALLLANTICILQHGEIVKKYAVDSTLPRKMTDHEDIRKSILNDLLNAQ